MDDNPIDALEQVVDNIVIRQRWETGNRLGLLWCHAGVGIFAGITMLTNGTASTFELAYGDWTRLATGIPALLGGLLLARGLLMRPRSITREAIGLGILGLWDLVMTLGFVTLLVHIGQPPRFFLPWSIQHPPYPLTTLYPLAVYGGYLALIAVHLYTLRHLHKVMPRG